MRKKSPLEKDVEEKVKKILEEKKVSVEKLESLRKLAEENKVFIIFRGSEGWLRIGKYAAYPFGYAIWQFRYDPFKMVDPIVYEFYATEILKTIPLDFFENVEIQASEY